MLNELAGEHLDVLVVGAGIVGACTARDAALRGLRVGLVDRGDIAGGATSNCLKIVHGGLRYLQHLDLRRMRESIRERSYWLRAAPHLVQPLPVVMPTFAGGFPPHSAFRAALALNDLFGWDRNRGVQTELRLPPSRLLSRRECADLIPEIATSDLTGGVHFHDALMYSPERLALEVVESARQAGAVVAPYVAVTRASFEHGAVRAAVLHDTLNGDIAEVRTRWIINATGSSAGPVARQLLGHPIEPGPRYSIALNLVTRQPARGVSFTVTGGSPDPDRVVKSGGRQLFVVPWRGQTLLGTAHLPLAGPPDDFELQEEHVESFLAEVAGASPALNLQRSDVVLVHRGLLPVADSHTSGGIRLLKHHVVRDHAGEGARGVITVHSVKYTTARLLAEQVVDRICRGDQRSARCLTATTRLPGAAFHSLTGLKKEAHGKYRTLLDEDVLDHLVHSYGSRYELVLGCRDRAAGWNQRVHAAAPVINAQLWFAAEREFARTTGDVIWRRTELGPRGLAGGNGQGAEPLLRQSEERG